MLYQLIEGFKDPRASMKVQYGDAKHIKLGIPFHTKH